ncbi:hypothetical protein Cgig2_019269 [Carnegiea gigantea]|uniref:Uncharacterized protein n=1 Tax=Carnegiea gigantea TaxID=171969 RepID=A0A9Q1KPA3_9CARY|nr:hypothetical protein Cgig2_019269 [Carnegiea gigantea]
MVGFKNRYMVMEIFLDPNKELPVDDPIILTQFNVSKAIKDSILINFGECGLASSLGSFQVKYVNPITKVCIIRTSREGYQKVWSAISLVSSIGNCPAFFNLLALSGSIKACRKAAMSCEEGKFEQYKLGKGVEVTDELNRQMHNCLERIKVWVKPPAPKKEKEKERKTLTGYGCSTYVLYACSFMNYNHRHSQTFVIVAGALLGAGAGLLWAGHGAIMTSYPTSRRKGTYISIFWYFDMRGVIGGLIPFVLNYSRSEAASVKDGTYIGFMCFVANGGLLSLAILPPSRVIRDDGTRCTHIKYSNVSTELVEILKLFWNWKMLLIMLGSVGIGYLMDFSFQSRRKRGCVGIVIVGLPGTAIWGGGLANQLRYSRDHAPEKLDFKDSGSAYAGPFLLYFSYGLLDAMFQSMVYWVIGGLGDDSETFSRYSGFYEGVPSAGAAVAWQIDVHSVSYLHQLIINWALTTVSYPILLLLVMLAVKDDDRSAEHAQAYEDIQDMKDAEMLIPSNNRRGIWEAVAILYTELPTMIKMASIFEENLEVIFFCLA